MKSWWVYDTTKDSRLQLQQKIIHTLKNNLFFKNFELLHVGVLNKNTMNCVTIRCRKVHCDILIHRKNIINLKIFFFCQHFKFVLVVCSCFHMKVFVLKLLVLPFLRTGGFFFSFFSFFFFFFK